MVKREAIQDLLFATIRDGSQFVVKVVLTFDLIRKANRIQGNERSSAVLYKAAASDHTHTVIAKLLLRGK
jgi:hypothetical protein